MPDGTVLNPSIGVQVDSEAAGQVGQVQRVKIAQGPRDVDYGDGLQHASSRNTTTFTQLAIKAGAGVFGGFSVFNGGAAAIFIQVFDALTGSVTPGTTTPDFEFTVANGAHLLITFPFNITMVNGITLFSSTAEKGATGSVAGVNLAVFYN